MRRGRGRGGGRHPKAPSSSAAVDRTPMTDQPLYPRNLEQAFSRRDSDAFSVCSSMGTAPSHAAPITSLSDRASQAAALRAVNAYLVPAAIHLRSPLPPAKDIIAAFHHLADRLRYPLKAAWEDDLLALLRSLGCPYKVTRSALKAPGTPHSWPPLLSILYWLTLLCRATAGLGASPTPSTDLTTYITESYNLFLTGDDDAVDSLDDDYHAKARAEIGEKLTAIQELEKEVQDLEAKRSKQMSAPSRLKAMEEKKDAFTADVQKFENVVKTWSTKIEEKEVALVEKEKELEAKVLNCQQTMAENEELVKQVETQVVNVRDVDRMAREMQAVENDIAKLENVNAALEEKGWELEAALVSKLEEIEGLAELCNQFLRKLKPSIDFQYEVNAKGSSPAEILGTTYKTTLKPTLNALFNETNRLIISKRDESIDLQKQLQGIVKMLEEKRSHVSVLQAKHNERFRALQRPRKKRVRGISASARGAKRHRAPAPVRSRLVFHHSPAAPLSPRPAPPPAKSPDGRPRRHPPHPFLHLSPGDMGGRMSSGVPHIPSASPGDNEEEDEDETTNEDEESGEEEEEDEDEELIPILHSCLVHLNHNMTAQTDSLDREIQSHVSRCASDARKMKDELEKKEHHLTTIEKEAEVFVKNSEEGLQAALRETDEETQMCARELLKLIDSIAEYKEFVEQSIAEIKKDLYECADDIASLSSKIVV